MNHRFNRWTPVTVLVATAITGAVFASWLWSAQRSTAPGALAQVIGVRGHWNIEVRDADGTVAATRAFDNAFVDGQNTLVESLLGTFAPGAWGIQFMGFPSPCVNASAQPDICVIRESRVSHADDSQTSYSLVARTGTSNHILLLSGSKFVSGDGQIATVRTVLGQCPADTTPIDCDAFDTGNIFTRHDLATPIDVVEGQQVIISVEINFAAAS